MTDTPETDTPETDAFDRIAARFGEAPDDGGEDGADAPEDDGDGAPGGPIDPALAEILTRTAALALNDHGNGQRLVAHFGEDLMFVPRVGWHGWDKARWVKDPDKLAVRGHAQRLADLILAEIPFLVLADWERRAIDAAADAAAHVERIEAIAAPERTPADNRALRRAREAVARADGVKKGLKDRRAQHRRFATSTGNSSRITNAMAEAEVALAVPLERLDAASLDICAQNGVLRFDVAEIDTPRGKRRAAEVRLIPHDRAQRMTKMLATAYDPAARAPRFEAFLAEVQPDIEMRMFLQRWFGLSMSAEPMQALAFFYGMGANGKSVLVDVIARILSDYAATVRIESLTGTNRRGGADATPDLIPLIGARFARTSEPDQGTRLQEGLIKELTGGEPILVRALHEDFVEIKPCFKLTISGNHKPEIRGTDDGIWRRVMLVPWEVQIPDERRDLKLADALVAEAPGILNWLVEGLLSYLEGGLAPPDVVRAATEEYRLESDPLGAFLMACCAITGDERDVIPAAEIVNGFTLYMMDRGDTPWKNRTVALQMADKAERWKHPETGRSFRKTKASVSQYAGLRWTDAFKKRFSEAVTDASGRPLSTKRFAPDPDFGA